MANNSNNNNNSDGGDGGGGSMNKRSDRTANVTKPGESTKRTETTGVTVDTKSSAESTSKDTAVDTEAVADDESTTGTNTKRAKVLDALKKKSEAARDKTLVEQMSKIDLFDSTKASEWRTTGTHALGAMKTDAKAITISGRNIGAEQKEPDWTPEQLAVISTARSTTLNVMNVTNTRRSVIDPKMEFVGRNDDGSVVPTEKAYVSTLDPSQYCIGVGPEKHDITGTPRFYADIVVADINGQWLVNQWTSEFIVIEGVAQNVMMQANRAGNTSGRRIGHHFARIGLPAYAFGPVLNTLSAKYPGCMSQMTTTAGYYWVNASWGVSNFSATFSYMASDSNIKSVTNLADVMRMLNGKSALCLGTIAISLTCPANMIDGKPTPDRSVYGLSIKMHNAFSVDLVDYHGPPQQGSTGMIIPSRIAGKAKTMGIATGVSGGMSSIFAQQSSSSQLGPGGMVAPTNKTVPTKQYM